MLYSQEQHQHGNIRHSKASCDAVSRWRSWTTWTTCTHLNGLQVLPHATSRNKDPKKLGGLSREQWSAINTCLNHSLFGGRLVVDAPVHLLSLRFVLKQLKWIPGGLCFLIRRTDITEVSLTLCKTGLIKFCLDFISSQREQ